MKILTEIEIFRIYSPKILTKNEISLKFWAKSRLSEILVKIGIFKKKMTKFEIFWKFWQKSRSLENFDQIQSFKNLDKKPDLSKISLKSRFSGYTHQNQDLKKI